MGLWEAIAILVIYNYRTVFFQVSQRKNREKQEMDSLIMERRRWTAWFNSLTIKQIKLNVRLIQSR